MNPNHFDAFTRAVTASPTRRSIMSSLAGGMLAAGGLSGLDAEARKKKKKRKKKGGKGKGKDKGKTIPSGPVFSVSGRDILTPQGNRVLLRGVNKMSVFDEEDLDGSVYFPEIAKSKSNTVRIVWAINSDRGPTTEGQLEKLITNAKNAGLLPMVELHDATGDLSQLPAMVDYWTKPSVVNIINSHSDHVLLNIANECGDDTVEAPEFIAAYTSAVQRIRRAGIRTPLVIDAPDFGKNLGVLNESAAALLAADPDRNLIFSVHLYWPINGGAGVQFITQNLQTAASLGYPLISGEFSKFGAFNPNGSICAEGGRTDYVTMLRVMNELQIGWYAWEWGPGNEFGDAGCAVMDMTTNGKFANLKAGWATEVATTSSFSIKNTSVRIL